MTPNEQDLTAIIEWTLQTVSPPERITAALRRLVAQMPKPAAVLTQVQENEIRRKAMLEKERQRNVPPNGIVLPALTAEEVEQYRQHKRQEWERKQQLSKPSVPRKAVV
jgi:hypothetical protein